jgi:hypothetical protein
VRQETVHTDFLNRESFFKVEGTEEVRTNDLKGESH